MPSLAYESSTAGQLAAEGLFGMHRPIRDQAHQPCQCEYVANHSGPYSAGRIDKSVLWKVLALIPRYQPAI